MVTHHRHPKCKNKLLCNTFINIKHHDVSDDWSKIDCQNCWKQKEYRSDV